MAQIVCNRSLKAGLERCFPGIEIKIGHEPQGTTSVGIRVRKKGVESEWLKPTNVGFGISYCLPILLAGLLSRDGGMLIVDSPEAHLYPFAS